MTDAIDGTVNAFPFPFLTYYKPFLVGPPIDGIPINPTSTGTPSSQCHFFGGITKNTESRLQHMYKTEPLDGTLCGCTVEHFRETKASTFRHGNGRRKPTWVAHQQSKNPLVRQSG